MGRSVYRRGLALALGLICFGATASSAAAVEFPYLFEPELSLIGKCGTSPADPVEDPGCPGGTHPPSGGFEEPRSIAIDAYGNEYVASFASTGAKGRIDVFDDEGFFITEILEPNGPKSIAVDSKGNLYVFAQKSGIDSEIARYSPSLYEPEAGKIEYKNPRVKIATNSDIFEGGLAVDFTNDHLYSGQNTFIAEYGSAAEGNKLLNTITHPKLNRSVWVAVDSQRNRLFSSYCKSGIKECGVLIFEADPPYNLLEEIDGSTMPEGQFFSEKGWTSIAVDEENGHFFVEDLEVTDNVYEFNENYEYVAKIKSEVFAGGNALQIAVSNSPLKPAARNRHYLFVPVLFPGGRALAFKPPAITEPEVKSLKAVNIGETEAELQATIDPNGGDTEYKIEIEGPGIEGTEIVAQGTILGTSLPKQVGGLVGGLEPGASYSVRAFAENEAGDDEENIVFTTYEDALIVNEPPCPNQALRIGVSAALPDCRAYELVTPADTNGRPTEGAGAQGDRFGMVQSSPSGSAVSFEVIGGALPGSEGTGGFHGDSYRATRDVSGWGSALVSPTSTESSQPRPGSFSPDQGYSFFVAARDGTAVLEGIETHYVRYPDGHSALVARGSLGSEPLGKGKLITEGGTHIVFQTGDLPGSKVLQLEPNAPPTGIDAVYDRTADEVTHVVSLLPGDVTPTKDATYRGASADGAGIAFETDGALYLRLNNATTFQIGNKGAKFAGVSTEGKRAFYLEGGDLLAFDTGSEEVIEFTETGDAVPVNVAPSGTRAYFVSEEAISGSGPNPHGAEPQTGEQNLYLSEEGAIVFVATVSERDVEGIGTPSNGNFDGLGLWIEAMEGNQPARSSSRLTPDGAVMLFQSRADLDAYDSGEFPQIYRYDRTAGTLGCLSCPPTKTPATGGAVLQSALTVAAPLSENGFVPNLRADGKRAFFESTEALVSSDTDGVRDVYEWEEAGVGSCTRAGGCVYLISTGHSARDNYLFGHSASGDDVFFTSGDILVGGDEDTVSVYDARVNGGFAETHTDPCPEIDLCRAPAGSAPALPPSTSESLGQLPGSSKPALRCPKGKRKVIRHGKEVCIKKKKHRKHRKANSNRRAGK
jgi:hypothetical protein